MNRKTKVIVIIASILLAAASFWYFFADDLFLFILSRAVPPAEPMPAEQRMPCDGNPASFVEHGVAVFDQNLPQSLPLPVAKSMLSRKGMNTVFYCRRDEWQLFILVIMIPLLLGIHPKNIVSNIYKKTSVWEKDYGAHNFAGGRYWLWSSSGGDIVVYSCEEGGVSDPKPVR